MALRTTDGAHSVSDRHDADGSDRETRPTLAELSFGAVTVGVFVMFFSMVLIARQPLGDPDTWWHLVMGHAYLDRLLPRKFEPGVPFV